MRQDSAALSRLRDQTEEAFAGMRQDRRAIEDLLFSLFGGLTTVEARERELLRHNGAFDSFRAMIMNLPLGGGSAERAATEEEQQESDEHEQGSIADKGKDRAL